MDMKVPERLNMPTPEEEVELIARMICLWSLNSNPDGKRLEIEDCSPIYDAEIQAAWKIWRALEDGRNRAKMGMEPEPMVIRQQGNHA